MSNTIVETEWSYFWSVDSLDGESESFTISPDDEEEKRLCQRLNLLSIESLEADLKITQRKGEALVHVEGKLDAHITQNCVVSLDLVQSHITEEFEAFYADPEGAVSIAKARHEKLTEKGHGEQPILDERDDPEPLVDGKIDLGELVTQYLSLGINPYPHAEGVEFEAPVPKDGDGEENAVQNPFAALKDWKDKLTGGEN